MPSTLLSPVPRLLFLALAAAIAPPTAAFAQADDGADGAAAGQTDRIVVSPPDSVGSGVVPVSLRPWPDDVARFIGTALAAGAGSLGGLYGGALVGWNSGSGDNVAGLYVGLSLGTVLGAGAGSALVSGSTLRSLGGSLGGAAAGLAVARGMSGGNGGLQIAAYTIVHALVTALIATG